MKAFLALTLALATVAPASAEIFRPGAGRGEPRGGHRDRGPVRYAQPGHHHHGGGYIYRHRPVVRWGYSPYYYYPSYAYYSGYGIDYPYYGGIGYYGAGSAANSGFWLGALAGGIIGHNSGEFRHNGWRGAAWGAGVGWLLGSIADASRRADVAHPAPATVPAPGYSAPAVATPAAPATAAPQQVTIVNNYYNSSSPMSGANSLFGR